MYKKYIFPNPKFEKMSLDMNAYVNTEMNKMIKNIICKVVMHCGEINNFDGERMLNSLNLSEVVGVGVGVGVSRSKKCKEKKPSEKKKPTEKKPPMPFDGKEREGCCRALRQNHGLYTQCETEIDKDVRYCKKCEKSQKFGTIEDRLRVNAMEFRDPSGKAPTSFSKIMKKLGLSRIEVEIEASNQGIKLEEFHFEEEKSEKKEKGRPKKARKTVELEDESTDLFAALVAKANEEESSSEEESSITGMIDKMIDMSCIIGESNLDTKKAIEEKDKKIQEKKEKKEAEQAKKLEEKEAAKQAEKDKKEAAKLEEIQKKEEAKQAEIQKKAEKEAAKQAEIQKKEEAKQSEIQKKAEKEAAKLAEIQKKEEAKQAEIQKKAEKEAAKQAEIQKKAEAKQSAADKPPSEKKSKKTKEVEAVVVAAPEEEEEDVVKRFEFEGVKYLKSKKTGIIYNMDQDVIGKWNEKTGKIDFEEAGSEEEEEEYDE